MILNIQEFLDEINSYVNYCHWKSNMGLAEALVGKSDFDFLIDEACRSNFEFIATKYGFIETNTVEERSLNGAQDWIGFARFRTPSFTFTRIMSFGLAQKPVKASRSHS